MNNNFETLITNRRNPLLLVDSYKQSHFLQQVPGTQSRYSYGEARGSEIRQIDNVSFFGLQMFIKEFMMVPFTESQVKYASKRCALHRVPFPYNDLMRIVNEYGGFWPVTIRAVKEGTEIPVGNVLYDIEAKEPGLAWIEAYVETMLLRAVWYPTSVATISKACKKIIKHFLDETCDNPDAELPFKLHDFGARGVSSAESAGIGGVAHLVNFMGTDTMNALEYAYDFYGCEMAGFSIPASEHSTITIWGMDEEGETAAYRNMIKQFASPGSIFACVSDSRDIFHACSDIWGGTLRQEIIDSGATLVVRPDSGDPTSTVLKVVCSLAEKFGYTVNNKDYKVLKHVRVIQGDGVDLDSIQSILFALKLNGYSAENVAFGMGGALLQKVHRDTFKFAQKCAAALINGVWRDVYKDPIGGGKTSKRGKLALVKTERETLTHGGYVKMPVYATMRQEEALAKGLVDLLEPVYQNSKLLRDQTFDEIRAIAAL